MSFNFEEFFKSIDIIVEQRLADLSYDKTVIATIIDDSQKANSKYIVSDGTIKFDAYTNDLNYKIDDQVRVTIMNGDWSQKKFIAGLYTDNGTNDAVTYVPPLNNVFQNEYAKNNVNTNFELMANGDIISKPIWGKHIVPGSSEYILQAEGIYNVITLSGDFKTDLGNLSAGGYGLRLDLYIQGQAEDERIVKFVTFDSSEMIGNPYSFIIDSRQEKQIAIAAEGIVTEIVLSVYQGVSYNNEGSATDNLFYDKNGNLIEEKPIYFNNITIGFGSNLNEIADNKLQIYTLNSATYKYNGGNGDETNDKSLGLVWYNKTDLNEYIGFSDGIYDPTYDEIDYLKNSYADSRLTKNIGKSSVANDELSLTLAANIEESEPFMTSAYEALTTKLSSVLQALGNQIPGTSFLEKLTPLISSYVDEEGKNQPALLVQYRNKAERNVQNLVSLYQDILQYGYNIQNGLEATWGSIEDVEWGKENYYQNFLDAIQQAIRDVENFFQDMKAGTENDQPMAGYRGIYNPYQLRIDREIKAIELTLNQIISSSAVYGSAKIDDFTWLIGYKDKTKDDMPSYVKDDLSEFNNKYCIYWYRYNEGYKMQYIVPISEEEWNVLSDDKKQYSTYDEYLNACKNNNIEYQFGQFFDSNWERVRVDKNNNPIINFGLPLTKGDSIDGIDYFIKSPLKEQLLERKMDPKTESERYQAILFYNHERYNSNILTFINTQADEIPPEFAVDAADVIRIEHDVYSQDHYQIYSSANDLVNIADASRIRQLKCFYDGVLVGDEALAGAGLYWYIPINSTMLTYDKKYLIDRGFVTDADGTTSLSKPGYIYFYKEVGFTTETVELKDSAGQPVLDFEGKPVIENKIIINEPDKYFFYKVKSYYEASAQNNTILVEAHLENNEKEKITTGEIAFTFGTFGTNGTKYTLSIVPNTTQIAVLPQSGDNPPLTLTLSLRDANGDLLTVNEDIVNIPTDEPEQFVAYDLTVDWWAKDDQIEQQIGLSNIENSKSKLITISNEYDADFRYTGIVKGSVSFDEELSDGSNRRINLDTMYPVPFSSSPDYYISGPTMIVYNNQGTVSRLSEEPYKLFQHTLDGDVEVKGCSWELKYYDNFGKLIDTYDQTKYDAILAYMPKLNQDNTLMAAPMYCAFDDGSFIIPVAICKNENNDIVWSQPIIIIQNNYASSTLNDWNGKFEINEANGTILSTMIGAGKKNDNNTFDGVLMGDIEAGANFDTDNASGLGLYGFNDGAQSFHFGIDGRAFLGKAGRGRIIFDGNSGSISSASYQSQRQAIRDDDGKLIGYENHDTAGMLIDLDDGFIDMHGTTIEEKQYVPKINAVTEEEWESLPEEEKEHNTYQEYLESIENEETKIYKQSHVRIDVKDPYFTIHSAQQPSENTYIMYVGENDYYLQSDKYIPAIFDTSTKDLEYATTDPTTNPAADGKGMKIDLRNGSINSYKFTLTSKNIFLNAGENAKTYLSVRDNYGKVLLYLGEAGYFLKSSDFVQPNWDSNFPGLGTRIGLDTGTIESYSFTLKAGQTAQKSHAIIISDSGEPYLQINNTDTGNTLVEVSKTAQYLHSDDFSITNKTGIGLSLSGKYLKAYSGFSLQAFNSNDTSKTQGIFIDSDAPTWPFQVIGSQDIVTEKDSNGNATKTEKASVKIAWSGELTGIGGTFKQINVQSGQLGTLNVTGTLNGGIIKGATVYALALYAGGARYASTGAQLKATTSGVYIDNAVINNCTIQNGGSSGGTTTYISNNSMGSKVGSFESLTVYKSLIVKPQSMAALPSVGDPTSGGGSGGSSNTENMIKSIQPIATVSTVTFNDPNSQIQTLAADQITPEDGSGGVSGVGDDVALVLIEGNTKITGNTELEGTLKINSNTEITGSLAVKNNISIDAGKMFYLGGMNNATQGYLYFNNNTIALRATSLHLGPASDKGTITINGTATADTVKFDTAISCKTGTNTYENGVDGTIEYVKGRVFGGKRYKAKFCKGILINATDISEGDSGDGGSYDLPSLGSAGQILTVNSDGTDVIWSYLKKKFDVTMTGTATVDMDGYYTRSGPYTGYDVTDAAAYARRQRYYYTLSGSSTIYGPVSSLPQTYDKSVSFWQAYDDGVDYVINNGSFKYYKTTAASDQSMSVTLTGTSGEITLDGGSSTNGNIAITITGATAS